MSMKLNIKIKCFTALMILTILLTACSSMDQSDCAMANWYEEGVNDGQEGKSSSHYSKYQKDCSAFAITVDSEGYKAGWNIGIADYCTRESGFKVGNQGSIYQHHCPAKFEDAFFSAYQMGRNIYSKEFLLNRLKNKIMKIGDDLAKSDLETDRRNSLNNERNRLKKDVVIANIALALTKLEAKQHGF